MTKKNSTHILLLMLISIGCSNISSNNSYENVKIIQSKSNESLTADISDFNIFFERFNSDSIFQYSSIEFPLRLIIFQEETKKETLINKQRWEFTKLIENSKWNSIINKKIKNNKEIQIEYSIENTGVLIYHFFQYKNGHWLLTHIEDYST